MHFIAFPCKVRAGSLQDLVYKGGQAGITKASVTLIFDNRDRKQSPLGYEQYEEITVTRQVRKMCCLTVGKIGDSLYSAEYNKIHVCKWREKAYRISLYVTEHHGQVVYTPALYSEVLGSNFGPDTSYSG
jgi:hypothetical protein